jgi:hypothetical protein
MIGEKYKSWSSLLCNFHRPLTSSLLSPSIYHSTLFSSTLNVVRSLGSQIRTIDKITVLYRPVLIFRCLDRIWETISEQVVANFHRKCSLESLLSAKSVSWLGHGLDDKGSIPGKGREGIFLFASSYQMGTEAFSLGVKRPGRESDHSPPSSAEVKNAWSYISTPQYAFMAWCSVKKHRDNFTLPYRFHPASYPTGTGDPFPEFKADGT